MGALLVDLGARTITGLAVPYGRAARILGRQYRFRRGWARVEGRVLVLRDHDNSQRVGRALQLADTTGGLQVVLYVRPGRRNDRLLHMTASGELWLSVGIGPPELVVDPADTRVRLVTSAALPEISLTASPAFETR